MHTETLDFICGIQVTADVAQHPIHYLREVVVYQYDSPLSEQRGPVSLPGSVDQQVAATDVYGCHN